MIRVGPRRRIAAKTTTFATPAGMNAEKARPAHASGRIGRPVDATACASAGTASSSDPPTIAQAVVRSGECRRRIGAPKAV